MSNCKAAPTEKNAPDVAQEKVVNLGFTPLGTFAMGGFVHTFSREFQSAKTIAATFPLATLILHIHILGYACSTSV